MTAVRIHPDRAALEIVHGKLRVITPLDDMLKVPNLRAVLVAIGRRHMICRARHDVKRLQANDID